MTGPAAALAAGPVVLTPTPYAFHDHERDQVVTVTAYTTREPGLLIRSRTPEEGEDGPRWLVVHWQGEAIQGHHDYTSPWQALIAADQLGALGVDWRRVGQDLKDDGTPEGLWDVLLCVPQTIRVGELIEAVSLNDDRTRWDSHEAVLDLLAVGWTPIALTERLSEVGVAIPLAYRVEPLLGALAPLEGRPAWCGHCLPVARQAVDERGWLIRCPQCGPAPAGACAAGVMPR